MIQIVLFRNENDMPTFVIEGVNQKSLRKLNPEKNGDKYDHFERMKPDDVYRQRIQSGPIEDFQKTDKKTTEASWVDVGLHGEAANIEDDETSTTRD